jgi:hypothetical protein
MGLCLQCIQLGNLACKITCKVHVIYSVFADRFNGPKNIAQHKIDGRKNKVCHCY